jgi:hypothetical protein
MRHSRPLASRLARAKFKVQPVFTSEGIAMRTLRSVLLAGIAGLALAGSGAAMAQNSNSHVMTVRVPNGGVAEIHYTGDVAPQVIVRSGPAAIEALPVTPALFGPDSPFAMLDRISAEMDRESAAMFRQAEALAQQARSGQPIEVALPGMPRGGQAYEYISTMSGNGVCTQSVEITSTGNGPPKVVSHSAGNCAPAHGTGGVVNLPVARPPAGEHMPVWTSAPVPRATPAPGQDLILTSSHGKEPYVGLVREIPPAQR